MSVDFSDDPAATGFFAPTRFEASLHDCEVEGEIPAAITGTFYRACVDRRYPKRFADDNILNDDGAIDMFRFDDGHVDYRSRHVRTQRFLDERQARRALYGRYRNKTTSVSQVRDRSHNTANTAPVYHGGRLFMLKESEPPTEMDPHSLRTLGEYDYGGGLTSVSFTAHPKIDMATGEMLAFGYEATGDQSTDIDIYWIAPTGRIGRRVRVQAPYVSEMHDWAISEKHIVLPTTGMVTSPERIERGELYWAFDPDIPVRVGIMPRDGEAKDMRWFKVPPRHGMVHSINAVTEGGKVHLYAPITEYPYFGLFPTVDGGMGDPSQSHCTVRRWTFDLSKSDDDAFSEDILYNVLGSSFSRMDDRYVGHPFRYSFLSITDPAYPYDEARGGRLPRPISNAYARFDHATGGMETLHVGHTHMLLEPSFIPRSKDAPEGDGYLIGVAGNLAEMRSELIIADARHLADGVIARVRMPFRLHSQVHGWWVPKAELPFA